MPGTHFPLAYWRWTWERLILISVNSPSGFEVLDGNPEKNAARALFSFLAEKCKQDLNVVKSSARPAAKPPNLIHKWSGAALRCHSWEPEAEGGSSQELLAHYSASHRDAE